MESLLQRMAWCLIGIATASAFAGPARALAQDPPAAQEAVVVDSITVEGHQRLKADEIVSYAGIQLFQPIAYRAIQRAITALYQTGQFDDVRIEQRGDESLTVLAIVVKERPVLQRWTLRGVEKLEPSDVRKKITVLEGRPIDRVAVARSVSAIDSLYKKKGYYAPR
jgi:outer membrane protein insertion porin family